MKARLRRARLVDTPEFPNHTPSLRGVLGPDKWEKWRGRRIKVGWDPLPPAPEWTCETQVVWRVADSTLREMGLDLYFTSGVVVVCCHQIRMGR